MDDQAFSWYAKNRCTWSVQKSNDNIYFFIYTNYSIIDKYCYQKNSLIFITFLDNPLLKNQFPPLSTKYLFSKNRTFKIYLIYVYFSKRYLKVKHIVYECCANSSYNLPFLHA